MLFPLSNRSFSVSIRRNIVHGKDVKWWIPDKQYYDIHFCYIHLSTRVKLCIFLAARIFDSHEYSGECSISRSECCIDACRVVIPLRLCHIIIYGKDAKWWIPNKQYYDIHFCYIHLSTRVSQLICSFHNQVILDMCRTQ